MQIKIFIIVMLLGISVSIATDPMQLLTSGNYKVWQLTAYSITENGFVLKDTCTLGMKFRFYTSGTYRVDTSCHQNKYNTSRAFVIDGDKLITSIDTSTIVLLTANQLILRKKVALPGVYNPTLTGTSLTTFTGI